MTKNPYEIARQYMHEGRVMQLATLHDEQPRVNSLYYVANEDLRTIYWLSEATRRHSEDITINRRVGGAIVIKEAMPVVGLQFIGDASEVTDRTEQKDAIERYTRKYGGASEGLYERMIAGTNKHHLYKIAVRELELFDEKNFPGGECVNIPLD